MSRFAEWMDSLLVRLGSKPARIVPEREAEPAIEPATESVAGSRPSGGNDRDFFADELAQFEGGDSAIFSRYRERNGK